MGKGPEGGVAGQQFKVSSVGFISPDEKDKSKPIFMEETAEDVPQSARKIVPAARPFTGRAVMLIPKKQERGKQERCQVQQAKVLARMVLPMSKVVPVVFQYVIMPVPCFPPRPSASRLLCPHFSRILRW
jgi:hypothetical protein